MFGVEFADEKKYYISVKAHPFLDAAVCRTEDNISCI
jgi:hypothetical protein